MSLSLLRVRVEDFRGIDRCEVNFAESGVTVVHAPNELGKSSLMEAIDLVLTTKASSGAASVKSVKPIGRDVGSLVEVELRCGDHHLTCRKRFNRNSLTELEIRTPVRENLSGEDAHNRLREILDAEVDQALFGALWFHQGRALESIRLGDSSAIATALDAQAGGGGAGSDDALLDRVRAEFLRYFTPTGQNGQAITKVERDLADAEARQQALDTKLAELDDDITELGELEGRIRDLKVHLAELGPEVEQRRAELAHIHGLAQEIDALVARDQAAEARSATATSAFEARRELIERLDRLGGEVAELATGLDPDRSRLAELQGRVDDLQVAAAEAEELARAARGRRERAENIVDLLHKRAERDRVVDQQQRVESAAAIVADATAFLENCRLTEEVLDEIRRARQAQAIAEATLNAGAPTVALHAHRDLEIVVDGIAVDMAAGEDATHSVGDRIVLEVPEVASIEVRAGTSIDALRDAAASAARSLADACDSGGVADLAGAERVHSERRSHEESLAAGQVQITEALGDLTREELLQRVEALTANVTALEARVPGERCEDDMEDAEQELVAARADETERNRDAELRRTERDELKDQTDKLRNDVTAREATLSGRKEDLDGLVTQLESARSTAGDDVLEGDTELASGAAAEAKRLLDEARANLAELDPETVELLETNAEQQLGDAESELRTVEDRQITLRTRLTMIGEEGLGELRDAAEADAERARVLKRRTQSRAAAAKALRTELDTARDEAYRSYREPLRKGIGDIARVVFDPTFDVVLDEHLAITDRVLRGTTVPWSALSSGAKEQLAVLTALAAAKLAGEGGTPLILDDTLGYSDPTRLERLGAVLGAVRDAQVIVLTCVPDRFRRVGGATLVALREARAVPEPAALSEPGADAGSGSPNPSRQSSRQPGSAEEVLTCQSCGNEWSRPPTRGRKPVRCPDCA